MPESVRVPRMHVFNFPNPPDEWGNRNLATFTFEYGAVRVNGALLCVDKTGEPFVRAATDRPVGRRPRVQMLNPQTKQNITEAAVRRYFEKPGGLIDQDQISAEGFSKRIGLDGYPLDPRHPFHQEHCA